ncbi:DUF6624 domain-containing protein [Dyella sp. 20L07]|uniref:DUF6624 domain-containing protein n=1 Tax=Dyella sp. 20L07 TaxID=3384240 RepID=UPI003D2659E6
MAFGRSAPVLLFALFATAPVIAAESAASHIAVEEHAEPALHDALLALDKQSPGPLDAAALTKLKSLLGNHDWPTVTQVGRDGVDAAGHLVEHATADADFQNQMMRGMRSRIGIDIDAAGYAALNDRVEVSQGKPQEYGTQLALKDGKVALVPAESIGDATEYRDSIGLSFMDAYLRQLQTEVNRGNTLSKLTEPPRLSMEPHLPIQPALRQELRDMFKADQKTRLAFIKSGMKDGSPEQKAVMDVDAANIKRIKAIVDQYGFPTADMVGRNGVSAMFFLAEHAETDTAFMNRVLKLTHPLVENGQLGHQAYALMVDRQLVLQGKPQIYGSQTKIENGHSVPSPIADPAHLEERRAAMGMGTEADYLKENDEAYQADAAASTPTKH